MKKNEVNETEVNENEVNETEANEHEINENEWTLCSNPFCQFWSGLNRYLNTF